MAFNILPKFVLLNLHDMGATFSSDPQPGNGQDNMGVQVKWIGTPTGTIGIQVSNDYYPGDSYSPYNAGTWDDLYFDVYSGGSATVASTIAVSGSADHAAINLNQLPFSFYRVVYTRTSGSGLLSAVVTQKGV